MVLFLISNLLITLLAIIASPKVFTHYGSKATIQQGDNSTENGEIWTLVVDPTKTKNNGIEF